MILGMSASTFTLLHVIISLTGIASGLVVCGGLLTTRSLPAWTVLFLTSTMLTSVTGFLFPVPGFDPARMVGIISLVALAAVCRPCMCNICGGIGA